MRLARRSEVAKTSIKNGKCVTRGESEATKALEA
jgi:hypothetical protein